MSDPARPGAADPADRAGAAGAGAPVASAAPAGAPVARLLVVQLAGEAPLGWLGDWWEAAGLAPDVLRPDLGEAVPATSVEADGVVVLGGAMGANDDLDHPWLAPIKVLVADTVGRGIPFLGVCLGHQLAAVALGGEVQRNPAGRAVGLVPVGLTGAGMQDELLSGTDGAPAVQHNDDVVTALPAAATRLATAPDGTVQAARFGPRAWGVQFHPEASPEIFAGWVTGDRGRSREDPRSPGALAAVTGARETLRNTWRPLADRFASMVTREQDAPEAHRG